MPKKIQNSCGGFTADQWKSFTILFLIYALWDILPRNDIELWCDFVMACCCLCSPVITETQAMLSHSYLLKFKSLYGKDKVTPNMHLHTHLVDCVLDYGPVYAFWLFSFEGCNGIHGEFKTNQWSVQIRIMRNFTCNQFIQDMPLPSVFKNVFHPFLNRLASNQAGTLLDQSLSEKDYLPSKVIKVSLLSIGPVQKSVEYG